MDSGELVSYVICAAILNVFLGLCLLIFYRRRDRPAIQKRLPVFVMICSIQCVIMSNTYLTSLFNEIYTTVVPAFAYLWLYYISVPLFLWCSALRDMYVIFLHYLSINRLEQQPLPNGNKHTHIRYIMSDWCFLIAGAANPASSLKSDLNFFDRITLKLCFKLQNFLGKRKKGGSEDLSATSSFNERDLIKLCGYIFLVEAFFALIMNIVTPDNSLSPMRYPPWKSETCWLPLFFLIGSYVIIKMLLLLSYRKIKEPYGFKLESFLHFSLFLVFFIPYLLRVKSPFVSGYPQSRNFYNFLLTVSLHVSSTLVPVIWDIVTSRKLNSLELNESTFKSVFSNPKLLPLLKQIMAETFCMENIIFHEEYTEAHLTEDMDQTVLRAKLSGFRSKYLLPSSPYELNISDKSRQAFLNAENDPRNACEALCQIHMEVLKLIYSNNFPLFISRHNNLISNRERSQQSQSVSVRARDLSLSIKRGRGASVSQTSSSPSY